LTLLPLQSGQQFDACVRPVWCLRSRHQLFGQLQSSLNGGSLPHGGMDELMPPAPPLDADTPLDAALLLDVDTPRDP